MKYLLFTLFSFSLGFSQSKDETIGKIQKNEPLILIDNVRISIDDLNKIAPEDLGSMEVYRSQEAMAKIGEEGRHGLIKVQTNDFLRKNYQIFFKSKSNEYKKIIESGLHFSKIQYVVNDRLISDERHGKLAEIDEKNFIALQIIDSAELEKYNIKDKKYGVLITADLPNKVSIKQ